MEKSIAEAVNRYVKQREERKHVDFVSLLCKTNRFHVAVRLCTDDDKMW